MDYKPLILVTEDNEANRELIREILEDEGFRVNEAENGKVAVESALNEVPDLVLMDVEMPVMNGLEAIRALMMEEETRRIPIIVLTGLNAVDDRIKAFDSGAMDYVNKPFDTHELIAHVKSYLRFSLLNKKYVLSTINQETRLPNRAAFRERIAETDAPKLFLLKLEDLDAISRFYGDATGTEIEKSMARFLSKSQPTLLKENAELFHLGRGVFGFLANDPNNLIERSAAQPISRKIQKRVENRAFVVKDAQYDIDLTVVSCFDKDNILEKSEVAMEEAVRNKSGVMMADDIINDVYRVIGDNLFWLKKIKEAVNDRRLIPFFQPIVRCADGEIIKYEALLRMIDDNGDIIPPGKFLFIAKNSRYYHDITKIILEKSMETFHHRGEGFSVNLSALDIESRQMRDFMLETIRRHHKTASRLTFEIVEQEGFKFFDILKEFIKQVKEYGVKIAIDDFGSGYSNFKTLIDMDVDYIKIDGSLIKNIHTDSSSRDVVETIRTFADKVSLDIIAEFVENQEILDCLKEMGIGYCQGYFTGKPGRL